MRRTAAFAALLLLAVVAFSHPVLALDNGLARVPPLGYKYSTRFDVGCSTNMSEAHVRSSAAQLQSLGLTALGYRTLVLADCWAAKVRSATGALQADPVAFPSGMPALISALHATKMQVGLTTSRGFQTCGGRPGSQGNELLDAQTFASWGVDWLGEDGCTGAAGASAAAAQYNTMRAALNNTGVPIFFAVNEGAEWVAPLAADLANSFLPAPAGNTWEDVLALFDVVQLDELSSLAGPGTLIDGGLLLGAPYLNDNQTRAQFGQLAVLASPLMLSMDLSELSPYTLETLSNAEVLAVNQDPLAVPGWLVWSSQEKTLAQGASQIWARPLVDGSYAVHFINAADEARDVTCDAECFGALGGLSAGWGVKVRDLWAGADLAFLSVPSFTVTELLPAGGSALLSFVWQPLSDDAVPGPTTPGDPHSAITLDPAIQPRNHSTIPGYENYVEQCGEFVYRYFHTLNLTYPTMGQPYYFLTTGLDDQGRAHPEYARVLNGGFTPPKAGDILVAKGPAQGEFHTALIQAVRGSSITVFQANVAWDWAAPGKYLYARLPLQFNLTSSRYYMPPLPTSQFGYNHDFPVAGWIHPTGAAASLPGAPA